MHEILFRSFDVKESKENILRILDRIATENGDYGSGQIEHIKWYSSQVFENYDDAKKYIEEHDGWYLNFAVKYYQYPSSLSSKKLDSIRSRLHECQSNVTSQKIYPETLTSELITCKNCGSKLKRVYLKSNRCPVCDSDIRPQYLIDEQNKKIEKIKKLKEELKKEEKEVEKKNIKKAKVCWLVKFEYHC